MRLSNSITVMAGFLALTADVAVFSILIQGSDHSVRSVVIPKFLGLAAGFLVRLTSYRQTMFRSIRGDFHSKYYFPVELVGLYWHLVDLIWIYLFPLLYLVP